MGRRLEIRKFFGARALECDVRDAHSHAGDAKVDGVDGAAGLLGFANVVGAGGDVERDEKVLQNVGDLIGEGTADRDLSLEQRQLLVDAGEQFAVVKPDKVFEMSRDQLVAVGKFEIEPGAVGDRRVAVGNVAEQSCTRSVGGRLLLKSASVTLAPISRPEAAMTSACV